MKSVQSDMDKSNGRGSRDSKAGGSLGLRWRSRQMQLAIWFILALGWSDAEAWTILPYGSSPVGEYSGSVVAEFDRRTIGSDLLYVRRGCLRMGWSPTESLTLWGEGGVGSLQLFPQDRSPQGAYGPAFGVGWSYGPDMLSIRSWNLFLNGRATYFQSKLSDDVFTSVPSWSRRSRFSWQEAIGTIGYWKASTWGEPFFGVSVRYLNQDEKRSIRSGASYQAGDFTYSSGIQPGVTLGATIPVSTHIITWVGVEGFEGGGRVIVSVGRWGKNP